MLSTWVWRFVVLVFLTSAFASRLHAGMPSILPEDVATVLRLRETPEQRIQAISFFSVALLASAGVVQLLWNGLRRDFVSLPRLSYARSLLLIVAWGLLFCIVLLMISGARELMTPGAWKRNGITHELVTDTAY